MVWKYLCARMGEDDDSGTVVARVGIWGWVNLGILWMRDAALMETRHVGFMDIFLW